MLSEFERHAWNNRASSKKHPPAMACKAAIDQIERGELGKVIHAVVVLVERDDEGDLIHILQAGDMSELAVEGALNRVIYIQAKS